MLVFDIVELVDWGYERNVTLRGAPYDFRFAPHSLDDYYIRLKALIEETYFSSGERKVFLLGHSQGGLVLAYFLRRQPAEWKDRFVSGFMSVGTPWAGSAVIMRIFSSGYTMGVSSSKSLLLREQQRSHESAPYLMPRAPAWAENDTLLRTPWRNYTLNDYDAFFDDVGYPQGKAIYRKVIDDDLYWTHPGVDTFCWYGSGKLSCPTLIIRVGRLFTSLV